MVVPSLSFFETPAAWPAELDQLAAGVLSLQK